MFDRVGHYALISFFVALPVSVLVGLAFFWCAHVLRLARRAFAPQLPADFTRAVDPRRFAAETPTVRTRHAIADLAAARLHLEAARGALVTLRPVWQARSLREAVDKIGLGPAARDALLLDASEELTRALVAAKTASARIPDLAVPVEGLDQPLVDPLDRLRETSRVLWLVLHAGPGVLRRLVGWGITLREVGRALAAVEVVAPAVSAAHASLVARYGSDADMRAMALTTAEATVRRRRALDDLGAAHARLRAAEGSLDAARRINVRLFLFGFGLERHDALVLSASTDLLHAVQSLQVAATREPSLAVDPAPLAVDLSDPFARSFPGRVIGAVLPRALRGLATTALTFGRLQRARAVVGDVLDAVATRRHAPEALVVAAAA